MHGLLQNVEVVVVGDPVVAGSSIDNNSTIIDMADYESVMFVTTITDSVDTGVASLTIQQNSANSDSGMAAVTGTAATATSASNDDLNGLALVSEVYHPTERYVQATRASSVANIAFGNVIAILVPRSKPVTQGATVSDTGSAAN